MSRALRRHHRRRIIARHVRQYRELFPGEPLPTIEPLVYVGCQRPRRSTCHPHKLDHIDRRVSERHWRSLERVAW